MTESERTRISELIAGVAVGVRLKALRARYDFDKAVLHNVLGERAVAHRRARVRARGGRAYVVLADIGVRAVCSDFAICQRPALRRRVAI